MRLELLLCAALGCAGVNREAATAGAVTLEESRSKEVAAFGAKFGDLVRARDVRGLERFIHEGGVQCMDEVVPRARVVSSMRTPGSHVHAALFDGVQLRKLVQLEYLERQWALAEILDAGKGEEVEFSFAFEGGSLVNAVVSWQSDARKAMVYFHIVRLDDRWWISEGLEACHLLGEPQPGQ